MNSTSSNPTRPHPLTSYMVTLPPPPLSSTGFRSPLLNVGTCKTQKVMQELVRHARNQTRHFWFHFFFTSAIETRWIGATANASLLYKTLRPLLLRRRLLVWGYIIAVPSSCHTNPRWWWSALRYGWGGLMTRWRIGGLWWWLWWLLLLLLMSLL